jgi:hypothetical protein
MIFKSILDIFTIDFMVTSTPLVTCGADGKFRLFGGECWSCPVTRMATSPLCGAYNLQLMSRRSDQADSIIRGLGFFWLSSRENSRENPSKTSEVYIHFVVKKDHVITSG